MSKFTPGPWLIVESEEYDEVEIVSGLPIKGGGLVISSPICAVSNIQDATLLRAALEMYELLQKSLTQLSIHTVNAGVASDIQKLLNKIEGSSK